ncbi:MAG: cyclophilin-like family protein, partial [Thermofilum sp.]
MGELVLIFESIGEVHVELTGRNRRTAEALIGAAPFESRVNLWGDEIYF